MALKDLYDNVTFGANLLAPAARTATATSTVFDTYGYYGKVVLITVGVVTDGTHTPKLQESDDNVTYTDVAVATDQWGTLAALVSNTNQVVGYKGGKRYVKVVVTTSGATTGAVYGVIGVLGVPMHKPAPKP
jgi:hypothetical protein